ncbi:YecA family protein [Sulfitobacter sp. W027]|uniref:YecA/YgfB family protein n=1 Tax=Sulfitobacter sp. W027 TaxID=2867025 RepID=UPI0021A5DC34|nr:YecA family protein [Sulfitobacter sp. W027]UWR33748.1 YecA family protein [Sulfitobacter sp. W027]
MKELANLDTFLSSDESPDDCMMLSDLDGYLTGIACSPEVIPEPEWMALALGGTLVEVPEWVKQTIGALFGNILQKLQNDPPFVKPIFWLAPEGDAIAMDWCAGFIDAVSLRPRKRLRLTESGTQGHLMPPHAPHAG